MPQFSVMFQRFPGLFSNGACEHPDVTDWMVCTVIKCKRDVRIKEILNWRKADTPAPMIRNQGIHLALERGVDFLCMVDSDMAPDYLLGEDAAAKPFWDSSFDFMLHDSMEPCIVAAPYCGPPPYENCYIFRWASFQSDNPNPDHRLEMYTREEAAVQTGIQRVAALPTGLILIDMRCLAKIKPPYFYYEWKDETEQVKASTEDVTFTRDLTFAGVPIYCNWDAWAGHWKMKRVGKPQTLTADDVSKKYRDAVLASQRDRDIVTRNGAHVLPPGEGRAATICSTTGPLTRQETVDAV